jgi:hypothetical protein
MTRFQIKNSKKKTSSEKIKEENYILFFKNQHFSKTFCPSFGLKLFFNLYRNNKPEDRQFQKRFLLF